MTQLNNSEVIVINETGMTGSLQSDRKVACRVRVLSGAASDWEVEARTVLGAFGWKKPSTVFTNNSESKDVLSNEGFKQLRQVQELLLNAIAERIAELERPNGESVSTPGTLL